MLKFKFEQLARVNESNLEEECENRRLSELKLEHEMRLNELSLEEERENRKLKLM